MMKSFMNTGNIAHEFLEVLKVPAISIAFALVGGTLGYMLPAMAFKEKHFKYKENARTIEDVPQIVKEYVMPVTGISGAIAAGFVGATLGMESYRNNKSKKPKP